MSDNGLRVATCQFPVSGDAVVFLIVTVHIFIQPFNDIGIAIDMDYLILVSQPVGKFFQMGEIFRITDIALTA